MKWLYVAVAFVLGAAITWLLTVRRASRAVPIEGPLGGAEAPPGPDASDAEDEATGFGGAHTPVSDVLGAAEAWDRDAEDEDALLPAAPDVSMPPVAAATPNGDVAGVGDPGGVAAVDEQVAENVEAEPRDGGTPPAP